MKCPHCNNELDVRLIKAPPMQADAAKRESNGASDLGSLLERIDDSRLEGIAEKFVTETRERFEQYGAKTRMSEKQMAWIRKLAAGDADEWR